MGLNPRPSGPEAANTITYEAVYELRSKSSRKNAITFLFGKSAELNNYSYIDKHDLYLYITFCCSGMNTMLTVVAMETLHHNYRPVFVLFVKSRCLMMTLHLIVYLAFFTNLCVSKVQYVCGDHMTSYECMTSFFLINIVTTHRRFIFACCATFQSSIWSHS